jgi:predicted CXXCH cytochrome family protein
MSGRKEVKYMRKTALIIGIVAGIAMAFMAGLGTSTQTASADNGPHVATGSDATPDKCASCHRIHTGQNEYLLKEAGSVEDFCYACHGTGGPGSDLAAQEGTFYGGTTPGFPYGGKTASSTVGLRAGGFDEARYNSTDPSQSVSGAPTPTPVVVVSIGVLATPQPVNSRHDMEVSGTMWGNGPAGTVGPGPSATLECTSCHDPHGNGNYRILRTVPTGSGGSGFAIPDTYGKTLTGYTTSNYFTMNADVAGDGTPDPTPARYAGTATPAAGVSIMVDTATWCSQCHTRYLAHGGGVIASPSPDPDRSRFYSGDAIFTYRHTSAGYSLSNPTPAPTTVPQATPSVSFNNRACITCHASHGSNSSMPGTYSSSVPYPGGATPAPGDERAAMLKMDNRGMCRKCHSIYRVP